MTLSTRPLAAAELLAVAGIAVGGWLIRHALTSVPAGIGMASAGLVLLGSADVLLCVALAGWSLHRRLKSANRLTAPWPLLAALPLLCGCVVFQVSRSCRLEQATRVLAERGTRLEALENALGTLASMLPTAGQPADDALWRDRHDRYWQLHESLRYGVDLADDPATVRQLEAEVQTLPALCDALLSPQTGPAAQAQAREELLAQQRAAQRLAHALREATRQQLGESEAARHASRSAMAALAAVCVLLVIGQAGLLVIACRELLRRASAPPASATPPVDEKARTELLTARQALQAAQAEIVARGTALAAAEQAAAGAHEELAATQARVDTLTAAASATDKQLTGLRAEIATAQQLTQQTADRHTEKLALGEAAVQQTRDAHAQELAALTATQSDLHNAVAHLEETLASLPGMVWEAAGDELRLTYASPQAEWLFGRTAAACCGDVGFWQQVVHPEDRDDVMRRLRELDRGQHETQFPLRVLAIDGRCLFVHASVIHRTDAAHGSRLCGLFLPAEPPAVAGEIAPASTDSSHAFDEALSVILGHADVALAGLPGDHHLLGALQAIREAAVRLAEVAHARAA